MSQRQADLLLVLIAVIWGTTFTIVHATVETFPPLALIALRFWCAALVFVPTLVRRRAELKQGGIAVGALLGGLLFAGFATQTFGLQYTSPARGGFITGLNVVLVPLLGLIFGQRPPRRAIAGVALAVAGLTILSWGCQIPWLGCGTGVAPTATQQIGDLLILACALAFAMHIVAVSRWATALPVVPINAVQLLVTALLASVAALATESIPVPSASVWGAALFLGLIATAVVFGLQLKLQRYTTATHTALIFALEPVFAALFSWLWIGEALTWAVFLGGGLMLLGVIVAEVSFSRRSKATNTARPGPTTRCWTARAETIHDEIGERIRHDINDAQQPHHLSRAPVKPRKLRSAARPESPPALDRSSALRPLRCRRRLAWSRRPPDAARGVSQPCQPSAHALDAPFCVPDDRRGGADRGSA